MGKIHPKPRSAQFDELEAVWEKLKDDGTPEELARLRAYIDALQKGDMHAANKIIPPLGYFP